MVCSAGGLYPSTLRGPIVLLGRRHCSINTLVFIRMEEMRYRHRHRALPIALGTPCFYRFRAPLAIAGEIDRSSQPPRPVYGWFTEGFDTADLKDAKTLLDALG